MVLLAFLAGCLSAFAAAAGLVLLLRIGVPWLAFFPALAVVAGAAHCAGESVLECWRGQAMREGTG